MVSSCLHRTVISVPVLFHCLSHGTAYQQGASTDSTGGEVTTEFNSWIRFNLNAVYEDKLCENLGSCFLPLSECKAKCVATTRCTAINYKGVNKSCILRACKTPVAPDGHASGFLSFLHARSWPEEEKDIEERLTKKLQIDFTALEGSGESLRPTEGKKWIVAYSLYLP